MRAVASWLSEPHRHFVGRLSGLRCLGFTHRWGAIVPESVLLPHECPGPRVHPSGVVLEALCAGSCRGTRWCPEGRMRAQGPLCQRPGPPRCAHGCSQHFRVGEFAPLVLECQLQGGREFGGLPWSPKESLVCAGGLIQRVG